MGVLVEMGVISTIVVFAVAALRAAVPTGGRGPQGRDGEDPNRRNDSHLDKYPQQPRPHRPPGNADLRAVLPVGPGTAARRAAATKTTIVEMTPVSASTPNSRNRTARSGNADLRSAQAFPERAVRSWLLGVRAETGVISTVGVFAVAALRAAVPGPTGRTARRSAFPGGRCGLGCWGYLSRWESFRRLGSSPSRPGGPLCRPEVGVP